ncbi:MAG: class I SAM-dependent methyltransferase [Acidobacteria bacterium]|nr:class I SAM-dependent methyltransferase [Acidobacteriota bacterium]
MLSKLIALLWEFLRGSLPASRRERYGDIDYDWEHRVDTTSATLSWRTRLVGLLNSPYQPVPADEFREMMDALSLDFSGFTFIDAGSGKGRALLLASEYNFRRIIGIELVPELERIARENVDRLYSRRNSPGNRRTIELVLGDARDFRFPNEPTVLFLFNPLPESSLGELVQNLTRSLELNPRAFYVAYANPVLEHLFNGLPVLRKTAGTARYSLFAPIGGS